MQYPSEMFCFSGALLVRFMDFGLATGVICFALLIAVLGIVEVRHWVSSEIREAAYEAFDRLT